MRRALSLAAATLGLASPNPQVGCVLTRDGQIIGEGAHLYDLFDHAEIVALKQAAAAGHATRGATAYVTLEPCSHHGRTPPCADALIAAGISRCVIATADPNPLVAGRGIARLRAAGVEVQVGLLQAEARTLNNPFARSITSHRPFVTLKAALSVDGMLAPAPATRPPGQPFWLTGPAARKEVHRLRHASDAILTGIGTVLADDPLLTDRSGPASNGLPRRRPLQRVLLDTHLRLPLDSHLVRSAASDLLILHGPGLAQEKLAALTSRGARLQQIDLTPTGLNLHQALHLLHQERILSLLLEAGSQLNGAFLQQHLVDQVTLFYSEVELGSAAIPFAAGHPGPFALEQQLLSVRKTTFGQDVCISGLLQDPWPS